MSSTTVTNTVNTVSSTCMKQQNQYLTILKVKDKEDYGQYLLHTHESPPHDKAKTPCQLKLNYQTPQQSTKETSWDKGELFITMMQGKPKLCNKKLKNRKNRDV